MIPQNSIYQVVLTTNYDSLVNLNPNVANVSVFMTGEPIHQKSQLERKHSHMAKHTDPTYSVTLNDDNIFFILSLLMGDTATSTTQ